MSFAPMPQDKPNLLQSLAAGLRGAAGVLSPSAFNVIQQQDMMAQRQAQAQALQNQEMSQRRELLERELGAKAEDRALTLRTKAAELAQNYQFRQQELAEKHRMRLEELAQKNADAATLQAERQAFQKSMTEMQINARRDMATLAASLKSSQKPAMPKAPVGYRWNENGDELEPIPGGPKDKGAQKGRQLGAKDVTALAVEENEVERTAGLMDSFKDDYAGPTGAAKAYAGQYLPGVETDATGWWKDYRKQEIVMRNKIFGSALTESEKRSWEAANVSPSMKPDVVKQNLKTRADLERKAFRAKINRLGQSGYDVSAFGEAQDNDPLGLRK